MTTVNLSAVSLAIVSACIGKRLALEDLKSHAIAAAETGTVEPFEQLIEACRVAFCERFAHLVTGPHMGLASMQKAKVPGVSVFYLYAMACLKLARKASTGDAAAMIELAALTTGKLVQPKGAAKPAGTKEPVADKPAGLTLTVDDAIACIKAAAAAGALTEAQLATLRALTLPTPVKHMGDVVELPRELIAA